MIDSGLPPPNATHFSEFYGSILYYRVTYREVLWHPALDIFPPWRTEQTVWFWNRNQWEKEGPGFSSRNVKPIASLNVTESIP